MATDPFHPHDDRRVLGSPYGPHPHGTDESAGGADSSPHELEPSGQRTPSPPPPESAADASTSR